MPAQPSPPRLALLALGSLLLASACTSTADEVSPAAPQGGYQLPEYVPPAHDDEGAPPEHDHNVRDQDVETWPKNRIWLYLGAAQSSEGSAFTTGLRYGYFLFGNVGFGALVDYSARDQDTWIAAAAVYARPTRHFQITVAPGFEFVDGDNEPMIRTGFEYEFELTEHFALVPGLSFDIVSNRDNVTNFGIGLQASF